MKMEILDILRAEVKPALGCTGPISVSLATAAARKAVKGIPQKIRIIMDKDTFKNCIAVITPGTPFMGVLEPGVVGAFYGEPELGLEVLKNIKYIDVDFVRKFAKENAAIEINWELKSVGLYIEAYVETENGIGHVIISEVHDRIVLEEVNGKVIKKEDNYDINSTKPEKTDSIRKFRIEDFYEFASNIEIEKICFIKDALKLNKSLADAGLNEKMGAKFGLGFEKLEGNNIYLRAKILAAAASDARMSGKNLSAMSCARSGNVGIAASVPLIAVAEGYGKSNEELVRAVCLSYLLTIYVKSHIGRLSAMCACAIAASIGVGAGTSFLIDNDFGKIEMTIKNIAGSIGGILCDGAKFGCALKLSTAVGVAIESSFLASEGICIPNRDGIVCDNADDTIAMLGRIARIGMIYTDEYMCKEIIDREKINTD